LGVVQVKGFEFCKPAEVLKSRIRHFRAAQREPAQLFKCGNVTKTRIRQLGLIESETFKPG
jgi:hypothetical protein